MGEGDEVRGGTHLLCRSRPMMIRFRPPPVSGLLHLLNTVASQRARFCQSQALAEGLGRLASRRKQLTLVDLLFRRVETQIADV